MFKFFGCWPGFWTIGDSVQVKSSKTSLGSFCRSIVLGGPERNGAVITPLSPTYYKSQESLYQSLACMYSPQTMDSTLFSWYSTVLRILSICLIFLFMKNVVCSKCTKALKYKTNNYCDPYYKIDVENKTKSITTLHMINKILIFTNNDHGLWQMFNFPA